MVDWFSIIAIISYRVHVDTWRFPLIGPSNSEAIILSYELQNLRYSETVLHPAVASSLVSRQSNLVCIRSSKCIDGFRRGCFEAWTANYGSFNLAYKPSCRDHAKFKSVANQPRYPVLHDATLYFFCSRIFLLANILTTYPASAGLLQKFDLLCIAGVCPLCRLIVYFLSCDFRYFIAKPIGWPKLIIVCLLPSSSVFNE